MNLRLVIISILVCWVCCHVDFGKTVADNAATEFRQGYRKKYSTLNHPKANGLILEVTVPKSWSNKEAARPSVVQVFDGSGSQKNASMNLIVKDVGWPKGYKPTKKEIDEFFTPQYLKEMNTLAGLTVLETKSLVLKGLARSLSR